VSAGCKHCYAKTVHDKRHKAYLAGKLQNIPQYAKPFEQVQLMHERLMLPLKWKQPRTVFVNSVSDLFHEDVPFEFIDQVFAMMALTPQHTYQILTKRPERMAEYFSTRDRFVAMRPKRIRAFPEQAEPFTVEHPSRHQHPLPNVWLGTSVENQATADERIPHLLKCPAAVRFLSCEPLLGPVDLKGIVYHGGGLSTRWNYLTGYEGDWNSNGPQYDLGHEIGPRIDWVITGGESGPGARPMHPEWARGLRDQCKAAGVSYFFKQWGAWMPIDEPWSQEEVQPLAKNERWVNVEGGHGFHGQHVFRMRKVQKHAAGHMLDGVEHHEWPKVNVPAHSITNSI